MWHSVMVFTLSLNGRYQTKALCASSSASDKVKLLQESTGRWNLLAGQKRWKKFKYLVFHIQNLSDISYQRWTFRMSIHEQNRRKYITNQGACFWKRMCNWNLENGWESLVGSCLSNLTQDLKMQWTDEQKQNHVNMYGL